MDDPDSVLSLLTYDGTQAAEDLVAELLADRYLDLPHCIDQPFSNETLEAMEAMNMERNESNDESDDSPHRIFDVQAFEGRWQKHHNYNSEASWSNAELTTINNKHKESKMSYPALAAWVEAEYSFRVKPSTVGYHVRKALAEEKKRNS